MAAAASEGQETAAAAALPRGYASAELSRCHSKALAAPTVVHAARSAGGGSQASPPPPAAGTEPTALLQQLFADFPIACIDMLSCTPPEVILQGAVLTRPAKQLPPSLGRGRCV
jgi:hypothetical protein